jgi:methyl-accepting chemotaxis protein
VKKRTEAAAVGYDLNRVDKTALIIIWGIILIIIEQAFLKNTGNQFIVLIEALAVGLLVTGLVFFKINRYAKSLLMGLIPAIAVLFTIFTNPFALDRHYMLCVATVIIALYFNRNLLLTYGVIINTLLVVIYLLKPESLLGETNSLPYFLSIIFLINGQIAALYFLARWGRELIDGMEKSKADLQGVFDKLQLSSAVQEKQAAYMEEGVQELLQSMDRLSEGELHLHLEVQEPDEDTKAAHNILSAIAGKLLESVANIRGYIGEIASVLAGVSAGNLSVDVTSEFKGDFAELKTSINNIVSSLNTVLTDINIAAEQVAAGTRQVSDGSQAISQGATEQASSIEELTASVSEIASQTRDNAANADKANALSTAAMESAKRGSEQMEALETAMKAIDEASLDIAKIIKVIDDIAFQTNILALNAAVEAARAGVHGKGFGVVAEEVRNLAAKSAEAANKTAALIEGSVKKTEAGTRLASGTAKELNGIVEAVERAAKLVSGIAVASNEQATAILQVNRGIEQMSQVVQQNSATSEEAAAATEELSAQAQLLKTKVDRFTLARETEKAPVQKRIEQRKQPEKQTVVHSVGNFGKY